MPQIINSAMPPATSPQQMAQGPAMPPAGMPPQDGGMDGDAYLARLFALKDRVRSAPSDLASIREMAESSSAASAQSKKMMLNRLFAMLTKMGYDLTDPESIRKLTSTLREKGQTGLLSTLLNLLDPTVVSGGGQIPEMPDMSSLMGMLPPMDGEVESGVSPGGGVLPQGIPQE